MTEEMTTIVNVDDQEAGRYARRRMLERAGYRVIDATCGADAWRVAERKGSALGFEEAIAYALEGPACST